MTQGLLDVEERDPLVEPARGRTRPKHVHPALEAQWPGVAGDDLVKPAPGKPTPIDAPENRTQPIGRWMLDQIPVQCPRRRPADGHPALVPELAPVDEETIGLEITYPKSAELAGPKSGAAEESEDRSVATPRSRVRIRRLTQQDHLRECIERGNSSRSHVTAPFT